MSSMLRIDCLFGASANTVLARLRMIAGYRPEAIERVASLIDSVAGGVHSGRLTVASTAVQASGTVTFSSVVATNTVTIGATVFTGTNGTPGAAGFQTGSTDTVAATSLAAKINANTTTSKLVTATSAGAIVTVTAQVPGLIGNFFPIAISANGSVSDSGLLTGGSEDANVVMYNGI